MEVLLIKDVQRQLRIGRGSILTLVESGRLRAVSVKHGKGNKLLFTQEEIDRFLKDNINPKIAVPVFKDIGEVKIEVETKNE
jgi:excisionase family DNA binding protein